MILKPIHIDKTVIPLSNKQYALFLNMYATIKVN